ncbi:MAG: Glycosyl transferase group 1 [uncultured bacterium]|nr:MAG: Glycosyl transferase group 1 [uncultured bacterium]HBR71458.1 glycosyltransferase family 4 protein [Candidatus Moranbacteria bacterium]
MEKHKDLKVALAHDFLVSRGGAEKVLESFCELFPEAPIYTLLYDKEKMRGMFEKKNIRTSYLQKFPNFLKKRYQWLLPFFPVIPETFNLREYDLVISSSGAWSKGIVTKLNTTHIAYMHSPMRFVWDYNEKYLEERGMKNSFFKRLIFSYLRIWDRLAADRPDYLIANSKYTQRRIEKYYRRESEIIYPPAVDTQQKNMNNKMLLKNYFLVVSRLSGYKKMDVIINAFNKLELPLVIIGEGEQEEYLKSIAGKNINFLGWQSDDEMGGWYENARAFVFAAEEDFGIALVEAMSFGTPVIAYKSGGVLETAQEGVSGEFFQAQSPEILADGVRRFMQKENSYNREEIKKQAERFSKEKFKSEIEKYISRVINNQ